MKKLSLLLAAFLAGQALTLYKQDPKLQKTINNQSTFGEKCKIFIEKLFGYNKNLLNEGKEYIEGKIDSDLKTEILHKKTEITHRIEEIKTAIQNNDKEKMESLLLAAKEYIHDATQSVQNIQEKVKQEYLSLEKQYNLQEHIDELSTYIKPYLQSEKETVSLPQSKKKSV